MFLPLILYYQCLLKFLSAPAESHPWDSAPKSGQNLTTDNVVRRHMQFHLIIFQNLFCPFDIVIYSLDD